jgi:hypothetical protein
MASPKYNDKVKAALAKRLEAVRARLEELRPGAKAGAPGAGWGSVGLSLRATAPPCCTGFTNRFGGSTMRLDLSGPRLGSLNGKR